MTRRPRPPVCPSRVSRRRLSAGVVMAVALSVLAGACSRSPSADPATQQTTKVAVHPTPTKTTETSPPPTEPSPPMAPRTGVCHRLAYHDISHYSNAAQPVPCSGRHTAYTFAVKQLPRNVVPGVSIGNKSIQQAAATACRNAFRVFIGGDPAQRALSRLSVTYFLPNQRGFDLGARWIRCDVIALQGPNSLGPLPAGSPHDMLNRSTTLHSYGVCAAGDPGAAGSRLLMCTQPHAYRAVVALRLGTDKQRYPGLKVTRDAGQQRCRSYLTNTLGLLGGYTFAWTYPTVSDWRSGQRFGFCWRKTPH